MAKADLTAARLRELLDYDPETGGFRWREARGSAVRAGDVAGTADSNGYIRIGVDGAIYRAHRLAHLHVTGRWPDAEIDHIDGNRANNAWCNLRPVGRATNQQNLRRPHARNGSGLLGVSFHAASGKWRARIWLHSKNKSLGLFESPDQAHAVYLAAKRELHKGCTL